MFPLGIHNCLKDNFARAVYDYLILPHRRTDADQVFLPRTNLLQGPSICHTLLTLLPNIRWRGYRREYLFT